MPRKRFPGCDGEDFKCARLLAGRSPAEVAELLRVTARTVRNWESGRCQVPYAAFKLMRIMTGYALPGEAWRGWCIRDGVLWSPTGRAFEAWGMGYLSLVFGMAREFLRARGHSGRIPASPAAQQPQGSARPGRTGARAAVTGLLSARPSRPGPATVSACERCAEPSGRSRSFKRSGVVELTGAAVVDTLARPFCLANVRGKRNGARAAASVRGERFYTLCVLHTLGQPEQAPARQLRVY